MMFGFIFIFRQTQKDFKKIIHDSKLKETP